MQRPSSRTLASLTLAAAAATALVVLTGCSGSSTVAPGADATPVSGGTIVYAHQQEPTCIFGGWIEQAYLDYNIFDNLFSLAEDHSVHPWLAERYDVSDDGRTYTIHLTSGVTFTDGTPVDAAAIKVNFDNWVSADSSNSTAKAWLFGYYESARAIDATTVEITLARPYTNFIQNLTQSYFGIQSADALLNRTKEENCAQPIGSGAFIVEKWNKGQNVILTRNDGYTSAPATAEHTGPAYVEKIDWRFVPDGLTRVAALRSGEVDAIYDVPAAEWRSLGDAGYERLRYVTMGRPQQITFNTTAGRLFSNENLRKAFAYSLDRRSAVETIGLDVLPYEGNGSVSQSTAGYSQKAADAFGHDLDEANRLLDAEGWTGRDADGYRTKEGRVLEARFPYNSGTIITADGSAIFQSLQEQARAAGFKVQLIPVPPADTWAGKYSGPDAYDLAAGYWTAVNAGILQITWRPSTPDAPNYSNSAFYNSDELESLILAANGEPNPDAQNALYRQAQEYIADHALAIGVYDRISDLAVDTGKLRGVKQEASQGGPWFYDAHLVR